MKQPWKKAEPAQKRFKILLIGQHGTYKTRTMLRLADRNGEPALAVADTESGTDHYSDEFNFLRIQSSDADEIKSAIEGILKDPGDITCLGIDSISVYCEAVTAKYADLFLKREIGTP